MFSNTSSENMENLMTVVDRLDELQASSVGRRECSSTRQRTGARRMDVHVDTYSQPSHGQRAVATAQAHVMEVSQGSGVCAALCTRQTLCRHVTVGTPMVIFCCLTVFWLFLAVFDEWYTVPIAKYSQKQSKDSQNRVKTAKMTIGVSVVICLPRLYQQCNNTPIVNKNLAIVKKSRVNCAHNTSRAFIGLNITPWPWNLD